MGVTSAASSSPGKMAFPLGRQGPAMRVAHRRCPANCCGLDRGLPCVSGGCVQSCSTPMTGSRVGPGFLLPIYITLNAPAVKIQTTAMPPPAQARLWPLRRVPPSPTHVPTQLHESFGPGQAAHLPLAQPPGALLQALQNDHLDRLRVPAARTTHNPCRKSERSR